MKSLTILKRMGGVKPNHPLEKSSKGYRENNLTPITLSGVIVPWERKVSPSRSSEYKLVCSSGLEYFLVADDQWRSILSWHCWGEVKVVGLLNAASLALIPQRVFPRGPKGKKENVVDLVLWRGREIVRKPGLAQG